MTGIIGGGGGVLTLIQEVVTSGTQASVTFSSIPASFRDLLLVVRGRSAGAVQDDSINLQFNGDTGANYNSESFFVQGALNNSSIPVTTTGGTFIATFNIPGASGTTSYAGAIRTWIFDYRGTTFFKSTVSEATDVSGTGANTLRAGLCAGLWLSTSAITSVKATANTTGYANNSVVSLYGSL